MPVVPSPWRLRQEDCHYVFEVSVEANGISVLVTLWGPDEGVRSSSWSVVFDQSSWAYFS